MADYVQSAGAAVEAIGVRYMDQDGGTDVATGVTNAAALNAFGQDTGAGLKAFRALHRHLYIPSRGVGLSRTWKRGAIGNDAEYWQVTGRRVDWGGGAVVPQAEVVFNRATATSGGERAALICLDRDGLDDHGAVVSLDSVNETWIGGANVYGYWHPTLNADLWFGDGYLDPEDAFDLYADCCIYQPSRDEANGGARGVGVGKFQCASICAGLARVAFKFGDDPDGDQGDQWVLGDVRTPFAFTGFEFNNAQSISHTIYGNYEGIFCPQLFKFNRGGQLNVSGTVRLQYAGGKLLTTDGPQAEGIYDFRNVYVDAVCGTNPKLVECLDTGGVHKFGTLGFDPTVDYEKNFYLSAGSLTEIDTLLYGRAGMFVCKGGTDAFPVTIDIKNCRMSAGDLATALIRAVGGGADDSDGAFRLTVWNPTTANGVRLDGFELKRTENGTVTTKTLTWT